MIEGWPTYTTLSFFFPLFHSSFLFSVTFLETVICNYVKGLLQ